MRAVGKDLHLLASAFRSGVDLSWLKASPGGLPQAGKHVSLLVELGRVAKRWFEADDSLTYRGTVGILSLLDAKSA